MLDVWAAVITRWRVSRRAETWHMVLPTIRQTVGSVATASGSSNCGGRVVGGRAGGVPSGRTVRTVNVHRVPVRHRIRVRTTNPTEVILRLIDGRAAMKLVFASMIRTADRCPSDWLLAYELDCNYAWCCWNGPSSSERCGRVVTASNAGPSTAVKVAATG